MAAVPYSGAPDVLPGSTVPDDYEHEQATPAAFGGAVAQGAEKLGAGAQQLGSGLLDVNKYWGQIQTSAALNGGYKNWTDTVENYKSMRGQDALDNQQSTKDNIENAVQAQRDALPTQPQKLQFDQESRSFLNRFIYPQIATHANQQALEYASKNYSDATNNYIGLIASNADNPENAEAARQGMLASAGRSAHLVLGDSASDADVNSFMRPYLEKSYEVQAQAMAAKDPVAALRFADDNRASLGASYASTVASLRPVAARAAAPVLADQYLRGGGIIPTQSGPVVQPQQPTTQMISNVIRGQESGDNENAPVSVNGAHGPAQIMPATFAQYAKAGESIDNPADNRAVGDRIVADLSQRFSNDPARVAVGYFSGPGNVAPPGSPTPWVHDTVDGNGKSVSSYVQDVSAKLSKSNMLIDKASTLAQIDRDYQSNPVMAQAIKSHVTEQYALANMAEQSQALAQSDAKNKAADEYVRGAIQPNADPNAMISQLRDDPRLDATSREHIYNFLAGMTKKEDPNASAYGPAFTQTFLSVNAPVGDPRRINDPSSLLPALGNGQINFHGYEELKKTIDTRNNPGGEGTAALNNSIMNTARQVITPKDFMGTNENGLPDGVQAGKLASFQNAYFEAYRAGIAKGYTPGEMLTPTGPHSLYPLMDQFKPSLGEAVNNKAQPFSMDLSTYDLSKPEQTAKARSDITNAFNSSTKTGKDWDKAMGLLKQIPKPQAPISGQ